MVRFLIGGALFLSLATSLQAAPPPGSGRYAEALDAFLKVSERTMAEKSAMPRLSDPGVADLLHTLADVDGVLGSQPFRGGDLAGVLTVCNAPLVGHYLTQGFASRSAASKDESGAELSQEQRQKKLLESFVAYQDELTPLVAFALQCRARTVSSLEELAAYAEKKERYSPQLRRQIRIFQARMSGNLGLLADLIAAGPGVRAEKMARLVQTAAAVAVDTSGTLPVEARQALLARFEVARAVADGALHDGLDRILTALRQETCEGLCVAVDR